MKLKILLITFIFSFYICCIEKNKNETPEQILEQAIRQGQYSKALKQLNLVTQKHLFLAALHKRIFLVKKFLENGVDSNDKIIKYISELHDLSADNDKFYYESILKILTYYE